LASEQDAVSLAGTLQRIHAATGVAVLVMPQLREGAYGYFGAQKLLGDSLVTSHVLDVGGGSLQIAGERSAFGEALGQKIWQRYMCQEIRNAETSPCGLQPMTRDEVAAARGLLQQKLGGIQQALPEPVTMTAISRPVSRGVLPAVRRLSGTGPENQFTRAELAAAIDRIADLSIQETAGLVGSPAAYVAYLLSDMLLVEGLMQATGGDLMRVAEIDLTNLPGLLADDKAFEWTGRYDCYLGRLRTSGAAAYGSDLSTCPAP
jgi:exopolyphosphatase/pppGpp-phosphohydrolase